MAKRRADADTPLAREFARQSDPSTFDPTLDTFPARRTVQARDLVIWSASAGRVKTSALLPSNGQPNPVVVNDLVICSLFSPGRLVALDRETGKRRWLIRLKYLGRSHVCAAPNAELIYGGTSQELLAIEPDSGKVRWTFGPYGRLGETIYSSPAVSAGRLFIGDRRGYFHCLAAETGEPIWRVHTSRARNDDVNADPIVVGNVVAVATNAALALGFDTATGREVWRHRLDGPCVYCRSGGGRLALMRTWRSAYLISVPDGQLLRQWTIRGHAIRQACTAGNLLLLVSNRVYGCNGETWPTSELQAFRGGERAYVLTYPRWDWPTLRFERATGKIYETTYHGLGILDPKTGAREIVIRFSKGEQPTPELEQTHPPAIAAGMLYAINQDGRVFALRHP